jgi:hypothetical protein
VEVTSFGEKVVRNLSFDTNLNLNSSELGSGLYLTMVEEFRTF